jgi:hypothetical protein
MSLPPTHPTPHSPTTTTATTTTSYYARTLPLPSTVSDSVTSLQTSTASWRKCFGSIELLGANLTADEDVYNPGGVRIHPNVVNAYFSRTSYVTCSHSLLTTQEGWVDTSIHPNVFNAYSSRMRDVTCSHSLFFVHTSPPFFNVNNCSPV